MTCVSRGESYKKKSLSDFLEQHNATALLDCFRKGLDESYFASSSCMSFNLNCYKWRSAHLVNLKNAQGSFLSQDDNVSVVSKM